MRTKVIGGVGTPQLEKAEVSRLLDAVYIGRHLAASITKGKPELIAALDVVAAAVQKFGAKHLAADGTLKVTERQKRDPAEAPAGTVAP